MKKLFIVLIICVLGSILSYSMFYRTAYVTMPSPPAPAPPRNQYDIQEKLVIRDVPQQTIVELSTQEKIEGFFVQLYNTAIAFTVPEKVNISESFEVRALIDPSKTESELVRVIDICSGDSHTSVTVCGGTTFSDTIPVSRVVITELKGKGFNIKAITPEKQPISFTEPTEWLWEVKPIEVGTYKLFLTVNAVVVVDGEKETRQIRTFKREIKIEITAKQVLSNWFNKHWQWLWSALIVPIFIYFWSQRKKKRGASRR